MTRSAFKESLKATARPIDRPGAPSLAVLGLIAEPHDRDYQIRHDSPLSPQPLPELERFTLSRDIA